MKYYIYILYVPTCYSRLLQPLFGFDGLPNAVDLAGKMINVHIVSRQFFCFQERIWKT